MTAAITLLCALAAPVAPALQRAELEQRFDPAQDVGIDQNLGAELPLDLVFTDDSGVERELGRWFDERPVLLALVYYECPMLCKLVVNGVLDAVRTLPLAPGEDYDVVLVSIDPDEGPALAAEAKARFVESLERPGSGAGVHFLTGGADAIDALAGAVGFRFAYDPESDEFAHGSAIMVATPDGRLSRYLYGVEYSARDLRLALVEASGGTIGSLADQVLLLCYRYDPASGRYGFAIMTSIRILGVLTLGGLVLFILRALGRDRRARARGSVAGGDAVGVPESVGSEG